MMFSCLWRWELTMKETAGRKGLTIKQTANLYNLSIDALRYYEEIGLVVPERDPSNGYRCYASSDFSRLNVIVSLLDMDFSLSQIKELYADHTLTKSLELIELEVDELSARIDELTRRRKKVESCLLGLARSIHEAPLERIALKAHPIRPYLTISPMTSDPNDIPLLVAKRAQELGLPIDAFHSTPCFSLRTDEANEDGEFRSDNILMYSAAPTLNTTTFFPEGDYLSVTFSGGAKKTPAIFRRMLTFAKEHRLTPVGDPIEFWHVHEYMSDDPSEYIQTLEQLVRPQGGHESSVPS